MKQIRRRLSYANVMSSIAVFLVLGGGAAFAATQLPKNSVGTKQIKQNAVKVGKLGPEAVKAGKLAQNAVTTNRIRDNAVTGAKVNESTLGTVPSASEAANADKLGGALPSAYQRTVRWALVSASGAVLRQSGGISATKTATGIYQVDFGANVSNGDLFANTVDNGTAGGAVSLLSCADSGSAGFGNCAGGVNPNIVKVVTLNSAGTISDRAFYLGVTG